jgi:heavy metal sensor kinase
MKHRPLSIRTRLTLLYTSLLFGALVLFAASATWLLHARLVAHVEGALDQRIRGVENFLRRETTSATAHKIPEEIAEYASTQPEGHLLEVRDGSGRVLLRSEPAALPFVSRADTFTIYGKKYHVRAAGSLAQTDEAARELRALFFALAPALLLVSGGIGFWVSNRALAPVDQMTRAARSIGVASLGARLPSPRTRDELSRLAEAWNEMLERLESSVERMHRFTADAAHELRTPLTAVRTTAELAVRRERTAAEYRHALEEVVTTCTRMSGVIEGLLALARADAIPPSGLAERIDLSGTVRAVQREVMPLFAEKEVALTLELPSSPAIAAGEQSGIRQILTSLLDNALKYTPRGGNVRIAVTPQGDGWVLEVVDTGCGIPPESLPHLFERFYRVDPSRNRQSGGYGLGLAIAQQIADRHGTALQVDNAPGQGARFRLWLQREPSMECRS